MKTAVAWFARNPVAANLLMVFLIAGGLWGAARVQIERFPEFSMDMVQVTVEYPGAAPEEVEEGILVPIEEEIHSIEGVAEIVATASEGVGTVRVEVQRGYDPRRVLDDVKTRVDAIGSFPEEAEEPVIEELLMRTPVIDVVVRGDVGERVLKRVGERVRDEINSLPGISQVDLVNARPYEISIEVSEGALRRYGLSFDEVAEAVRRSSVDLSAGSVETPSGAVLLRAKGKAYRGPEFRELVLRSLPNGARVRLGDVATVVDGFADTDQAARFDGSPSVAVQVYRVGSESALEIARVVRNYVEVASASVPEGIGLVVFQDNTIDLRSRLELMIRNGLQGLALVFAVLAVFLRFRLAFWVTLGIPIAFLGTLFLMPLAGASINLLTLFGFILVLGIVVDDAIVVGESIHHEHQRGTAGLEGAIRGANRVAVPVTFAILTSIAAFLPLLFLPGIMGKFFAAIPLVPVFALAFSLVESKLVLPAHLAHGSERLGRLARRAPFRWWVAFQELVAHGLVRAAEGVYQPFLVVALRWRYTTLAAAVATLLVCLGLVSGGIVRFNFFPPVEGDTLNAHLTMPLGTPASVTEEAVERLERAALRLAAEATQGGASVVRGIRTSIGEQPYRTQSAPGETGYVGPHLGEVTVELLPAEERDVESRVLADRWRELTGEIPGAVQLDFDSSIMSAGAAIHVRFHGPDVETLVAASDELKRELATFAGVLDVSDSQRGGKREIVVDVRPEAQAADLRLLDLARQVRQGFHGEEAQRVQRGRDEVKVMVRYPADVRESLHGIESMRVRTASGGEVPFGTVAIVHERRGPATIQRTDRRRTVDVTADVDETRASADDVITALETRVLPAIVDRRPGLTYSFEGQNREQRETIGELFVLYPLALLAIYMLMAIPFRSYLQPLIVMAAIPFGAVGAVLGHMVMGMDLSIMSVLGLVALTGVVVNDSLVLVDFVNRRREEDETGSVADAARVAGARRFRPIVLTSLTTFAGLTPLLLERSVQGQFLIPMAISLGFGVLFSTTISLVIVPSLYLVQEDVVRLFQRLYAPAR